MKKETAVNFILMLLGTKKNSRFIRTLVRSIYITFTLTQPGGKHIGTSSTSRQQPRLAFRSQEKTKFKQISERSDREESKRSVKQMIEESRKTGRQI